MYVVPIYVILSDMNIITKPTNLYPKPIDNISLFTVSMYQEILGSICMHKENICELLGDYGCCEQCLCIIDRPPSVYVDQAGLQFSGI